MARHAVAITRAPRATASWIARWPTPPAPPLSEQRLAAAQAERLERLVGGQPGERQRSGLLERQLARHVREEALGHGRVLGVGAVLEVVAAEVAVDGVAGLEPRDRRTDLLHDAGRVPAEDDREVVRELVGQRAVADLVVDRVQRRPP